MGLASVQATKERLVDSILVNEVYQPDSRMIRQLRAELLRLSKETLGCLELNVKLKAREPETSNEFAQPRQNKADLGPRRIKRWLWCDDCLHYGPQGRQKPRTVRKLLDLMGHELRHLENPDCLFLADDGKYYVGTIEFIIDEADPETVQDALDVLAELKDGKA